MRRICEGVKTGASQRVSVIQFSFSTEEQAARDPLASCLEELGFEERKEAFGDVTGRREVGESRVPVLSSGNFGECPGKLALVGDYITPKSKEQSV